MMDRAQQVDAFLRSRLSRSPDLTVPPHLRPQSIQEGYAIQGLVHQELERRDDRRTGYKIGCATQETRRPFGLDEPTYGGILATTARSDLATAFQRTEGRFAIECEIAMRVGRDIPLESVASIAESHACIDACAIACELVQNRYGDPVSVGVPALVADDFFHYAYVTGPWRVPPAADVLDRLTARVWVANELVGENLSSNVLGHPLRSLIWLSSAMARSGRIVRKGDIILSGAIVTPHWVDQPPRQARMEIDMLGALELD